MNIALKFQNSHHGNQYSTGEILTIDRMIYRGTIRRHPAALKCLSGTMSMSTGNVWEDSIS